MRHSTQIEGRNVIVRAMDELGIETIEEGSTNDHHAIRLAIALSDLEVEATADEFFVALQPFDAGQFADRLQARAAQLNMWDRVTPQNRLADSEQVGFSAHHLAEAIAHVATAEARRQFNSRRDHAVATINLVNELTRCDQSR